MKLLRYGPAGAEKPGLLDAQGRIRDLSGKLKDLTGDQLSPQACGPWRRSILRHCRRSLAIPRLGPPVANVGKFIAIGLNFSDHAGEVEPANPGRAGGVHEGDELHRRPERSGRSFRAARRRPTGRSSWAS